MWITVSVIVVTGIFVFYMLFIANLDGAPAPGCSGSSYVPGTSSCGSGNSGGGGSFCGGG